MTDTDESPGEPEAEPEPEPEPEPMVTDPAKLIRLGTMLQTLMAEVRGADTDEQSRRLLARIHAETMEELGTVLSTDLMAELSEFASCCDDDGVPTAAEIRVAQAQLVGWLQGLLQGLQASMAAQQAAAAQHLRQLGAGRGPGPGPGMTPVGPPGHPDQGGPYL
jgi:hypothetical protein